MSNLKRSRFEPPEPTPAMVVAGGWARSGKGTSMGALQERLSAGGHSVRLIDQGIKFRVLGEVATVAGEKLDSPTTLDAFLRSSEAKRSAMRVLGEVAGLSAAEKRARLYPPHMSVAASKVAQTRSAHTIAVGLLKEEVVAAAQAKTDVILIDGRSMDRYARQFEAEKLGHLVTGWFFKCDPLVAARRSLSMHAPLAELPVEDRLRLLAEVDNISSRNKSDTLRGADLDPMIEPAHAYRLDLNQYGTPGYDLPYKIGYDVSHAGMTIVDTSYTTSVEQMTKPFIDISMHALYFNGPVAHEEVGIRFAPV